MGKGKPILDQNAFDFYQYNLDIAAEFSESEQQDLLAGTARRIYRVSD